MRPVVLVAALCTAGLVVILSGCGTGGYTSEGSQGSGKKLFIQACGGCHTLADAGTNGKVGPNLDDAFAQAREAGMTSDTFTQVVATQIKFPIEHPVTGAPGMPPVDTTLPSCDDVEGNAFCVEDQDQAVQDIAVYVGSVAGHRRHGGEADRRQVDLHGQLRLVPHACRRGYNRHGRAEPRRREASEGARRRSA